MRRGRKNGDTGPSIIGRNLLRLRRQIGVAGRDIEERTGGVVSQADVSRIEGGRTQDPGASKLKAIADALGVSIVEFWEGATPPERGGMSLEEFLASPLAVDVTDQEKADLRRSTWPYGPPTLDAWYHELQKLRAVRRSAQGKPQNKERS